MFVSIVSHGHGCLISSIDVLSKINEKFPVIVTDNVGELKLKEYCNLNNIHYLVNPSPKGFGENNNKNFRYAKKELGMTENDYFLVLNPDIEITVESLISSLEIAKNKNLVISTINLTKGNDKYDNNIRYFPKLKNFIESYLFNVNRTVIDKSNLNGDQVVDWASGSFLLIKAEVYEKVGGFDERYYMYCEDLDICKRIRYQIGQGTYYINDVKAKHLAAHQNRRLFSKHFLWHLQSIMRYTLFSKY